jgi:hypothetical protein
MLNSSESALKRAVEWSLITCVSRELLEKGKKGGLVIFEDRPNYWDAWGTTANFAIVGMILIARQRRGGASSGEGDTVEIHEYLGCCWRSSSCLT